MEITSNENTVTEIVANEENVQETPQETQEGTETTEQVQSNTEEPKQTLQSELDNRKTTDEALQKDLETKGVDFNAISQEFINTGDLSQETRQQLEKAGYPQAVVDNYLRGVQAEEEKFVSTIKGYAGTEQEFNNLVSFIQSKGQGAVDTFNQAIQTNNLGIIQGVINGFKADMINTYGSTNAIIMSQTNGGNSGADTFKSDYEVVQAMSDPRYGKDKAYTQEVEQKVIRSKF